jgi:hypothetical protein
MRSGTVGVIVNPVSGRDVRRRAARAGSQTPESKRNQVVRAVIGAVAAGAGRVVVVREPFRIATGAVELLRIDAEIEVIDVSARVAPEDTLRAVAALREAGCGALLALGGDGTQRLVARAWTEAPLVPLSTGTNNVFPSLIEPTCAGAAAGLVASGRLALGEVSERAKLVRVELEGAPPEIALVDAVRLEGDHRGSLLPYDPSHLREMVLAIADPSSIGVSPIGGLLSPCGRQDDAGLFVKCVPKDANGVPLLAPLSAGLYRAVQIGTWRGLALGEPVEAEGPGVLALDGDRLAWLEPGQKLRMRVVREGPRVIDVPRALRLAAERELFLRRAPFHDEFDRR